VLDVGFDSNVVVRTAHCTERHNVAEYCSEKLIVVIPAYFNLSFVK